MVKNYSFTVQISKVHQLADDARNPILKLGEKVKFIRVEKKEEGNGNGDNVKLAAKDVVFANGENVPVFRQGVCCFSKNISFVYY